MFMQAVTLHQIVVQPVTYMLKSIRKHSPHKWARTHNLVNVSLFSFLHWFQWQTRMWIRLLFWEHLTFWFILNHSGLLRFTFGLLLLLLQEKNSFVFSLNVIRVKKMLIKKCQRLYEIPRYSWGANILRNFLRSSLPKNEPFTISSKSFYQNNFKFFVVHVFMVDSHK